MTRWTKDDPRRIYAQRTKERAMDDARDWLNVADIQGMLEFAVSDFEFGDVLNDFGSQPSKGRAGLPNSDDPHYSIAFFKVVKSWVFHKVVTAQKERRLAASERK